MDTPQRVIDRLRNALSPDEKGCLVSTKNKPSKSTGYVQVGFTHDGKYHAHYAHRVMYVDAKGPIPDGLHVDHLCRNKACANVDHLELVTTGENTRRGLKGVLATHCKRGHEFTEANTRLYEYKGTTRRICRACRAAAAQQARDELKVAS